MLCETKGPSPVTEPDVGKRPEMVRLTPASGMSTVVTSLIGRAKTGGLGSA